MRFTSHSVRNGLWTIALSGILLGSALHCVPALPESCGAECPGLVLGILGVAIASTPTDETPSGSLQISAQSDLSVAETGSSRVFFVSLGTEPTATVTIPLSSSDPGEVTVAPASLSFDASNYQTGQTITVTGVDDAVVDTNQMASIVIGPATSADPAYSGVTGSAVIVTNLDDESPNIIVSESGASSLTSENGTTDTYSIVLTQNPAANVTINVANFAGSLTNGGPGETLLFTSGACPGPGNWCTAQSIVLSAVDDGSIEGMHGGLITHSVVSADPVYAALTPASVQQAIQDNDFFTFITAATHDGDFDNDPALNGNGDGDGIAEADAFCMADANRPNTRSYKALMVSPVAALYRQASDTADAGDLQFDWVMRPSSSYYQADGTTLILTTNANSIFVFGAATGSLGGTGAYWTGLRPDWRTNTGQSCNSWSGTTGNAFSGNLASLNDNMIRATSSACASLQPIVCVEQL